MIQLWGAWAIKDGSTIFNERYAWIKTISILNTDQTFIFLILNLQQTLFYDKMDKHNQSWSNKPLDDGITNTNTLWSTYVGCKTIDPNEKININS